MLNGERRLCNPIGELRLSNRTTSGFSGVPNLNFLNTWRGRTCRRAGAALCYDRSRPHFQFIDKPIPQISKACR